VPHELPAEPSRPFLRSLAHGLRFGNIGAIYAWIGIIIFFSIESPSQFPTWDTVRLVLNLNAITGLVALSLVVPLCAQMFDLSIGYVIALTSVLSADLIVNQHYAFVPAILVCAAIALAAGVVNGILVVVCKIESFIATLATGSLFAALVILISDNLNVTDEHLVTDFGKLANTEIAGISLPVFIMVAVAVAVWYLLEHTVTGRRLYATGFNAEAARLSGVRTRRLQFASLLVSALVAGLAGVLVTSQIGSGSPEVGPTYLLGSFAAVFLGATQFRDGRFNAQGTVVAVLMLATGTAGLAIMGAPTWASSMFTGIVLVASLAFYRFEQLRVKRGATRPVPLAGTAESAGHLSPSMEGRDNREG
jgi:ribose transport system permease protein